MKDHDIINKRTEQIITAFKNKDLDLDDLRDLTWYYLHRHIMASYYLRSESNHKSQRKYIVDSALFLAHLKALTTINGEGE